MNNQNLINDIKTLLTMLSAHVKVSGTLNQLSINVHCESFFLELLNNLYNYNLKNTNFDEQNSASIDLIDEDCKLAIQVTSDSSLKKTRSTLEKFVEKKLNTKVDRLIILNIVGKIKHNEDFLEYEGFKLDTKKDIIDYNDLIKLINNFQIDRLKEVSLLINKHLNPVYLFPSPPNGQRKMSSIHRILEGISDIENTVNAEQPDTQPYTIEQKIEHNKIEIYRRFLDKFRMSSWIIQTQIEFLEQNGQPMISTKLFHYVDQKFMQLLLIEPDPDTLILKICSEIKKDLEMAPTPSITLDDVAYIPSVVFFVFSKCKIFEKPPC